MKNDVEMGFAAEDNVFAKVKGFPPWPAKIKNIIHQDNNTYYNVEFYGTHEWAKLKFSDLYLYNDNKAELGKPKTRNPKFNKALQEIKQSISEYSNEISINIENDCAVNESVSVNNRLERRVAEHACELHNIFGQLIYKHGSDDYTEILQVITNILDEYNETVITNNLLKAQIEELESKCTHIEKALKKEKSLRLEELELSVCMEADVEMDVQKHKDTIKTLTQDLSIYIEDAKIKNKVIEELNANTTFLNNELNQLNQENSLLNSRISQLKLNIENEKLKFTSQVNDFKSLENTLKLQIAQFEQHQSNLNIKNLDGKDGIVNAQENNLNLCTTLLANEWIQDDVISLYFDFLLRSIVMEDVYFMNPCISQAIKCAESIDGLLEQEMISKAYVFIPINDSEGAMDVSGSHWSLMLYAKTEKTFYYFDSMKNYNLNHAKDIFTKMESHMCSSGPCCFIEVKCPQQRDGIECGVYMLFFVDWLIKIIWAQEDNGTFDFKGCFDSFEINESDIIQKRSIVTYLTYNLQYKKLREDIAKELIFCILNGKGDLKTNQSQVNIYEPHVIAKERAPASENTTLQYDNEETCSATSNNQEWSLVKGKHRLKYFNHQHSRKECKALSGVDTANRYDVLDGHSEIYEKENRLPINNLSANNLTKKISTDKSILVKTKNGVKDRKIKLQFGMEVNLCSDSQGSLLSSRLEELSNGRVKCFGLVRANTTLTQVIESALLSDDSPVILLGGSNDSLNGDFQDIYSNLENQLLLLSKTKPVFITSIPQRFDEDFRFVDDQDLRLVNNYVTELTNRLKNVFLIDLSDFRRFHYTTQGLHLNKRGKSKLAYLILNALSKWQSNVTSGNLNKSMNINSNPEDCNKQLLNLICHPKNCINLIEEDMVDTLSRSELEVNSPSEPSDVIGSGKEIKVLDADMWQVIEDLKSNDSIAFAHSISGDFDHPRRMTAGVAVTFAKQFGKPQRTDCITEFLACQRSDPQAAAVYSLITKDHYYGKPKKKDYDRAFLDLTLEFKKRKFSTLVCSPIGCVRDHVQLDHFAKNINLFHRTTGAAVLVITKEQPGAQRPLHLGLSYSAFISKLRDEIRRGGLVNQPDTVALTSLTSQPHSPHQVNVQRSSQSFLDNLNIFPPLN